MALGIGIELAPSAIRAVILEGSKRTTNASARHPSRRPTALRDAKLVASYEVPCDTSQPESLTRALQQVRQQLGITSPIVVGLPSHASLLTTVAPLVVSSRLAAAAVQFELQQYLPFDVAQAAWHYHWLAAANGRTTAATVGSHTVRQAARPSSIPTAAQAVVAAIRRVALEECLSCCRKAGVSVSTVTVTSLAILNAWWLEYTVGRRAATAGASRNEEPDANGAVLLHVLDEQAAEWVLWNPGGIQIIPVTSVSAETFWDELSVSWQALREQFSAIPRRGVVAGALTKAWEVPASFTDRAALVLERLDRVEAVRSGTVRLEPPARWLGALGLAQQGLGMGDLPINLLTEQQQQAQARRLHHLALGSNLLCVAVMVAFGVRGMVEIRQRQLTQLRALVAQEQLYQTLRPEIRTLLQRQQRLQERSGRLGRLVAEAPALTQLLIEMTNALPAHAWLVKAECIKTEQVVTSVLEGRAKSFQDVTQFLDQLKRVAGMTSVTPRSNTVTTDPDSGKDLILFVIEAQRPLLPAVGSSEATP